MGGHDASPAVLVSECEGTARMVGSPGTGGRWGPAESSWLGGRSEIGGVEEAEVEGRDGPGCCSTGPGSATLGASDDASSPAPSFSGSGEVDEEREVVEEVVEDEEWGEVSEEEAGGGKDTWWVDCGSDDSSPPADMEAADAGPEAAPPPAAPAPPLYS